MAPDPRSIAATTHGHYLVEAPQERGPHPLLVGFHGYGETAEAHLTQLRRIPGSSRCVLVSVQGLHLFYTRAGAVVASWMTKLGREQAIQDNVAYVAAVMGRLREEYGNGDVGYVGFSQGAAMAYRAAVRSGHPCQALLAIGGDMPPEIASDESVRWPAVLLTRGETDGFFTAEKMDHDADCLRRRGADVRTVVFDGGHEWAEPVFAAAGEILARTLGVGRL
ncbi:MAG TPA: dienelactone hydrolase family protein [Vicinamibacteria bacterium]|nr:dienelactone hydrolase family protein [Vicinamibacteria bacterium]